VRGELLVALACCACRMSEADEPIGLVVNDLSAFDAANLEEAARCWNLEFGTQLVMGAADQQVEVFYDEFTCTHGAAAQVQNGWPMRLAVCPQQYWPEDLTATQTPFRVLSHELGHVLNILGHPADPLATMMGGGTSGYEMFRPADREMFFGANPDFVGVDACAGRVIRWMRPPPEDDIGHCNCEP